MSIVEMKRYNFSNFNIIFKRLTIPIEENTLQTIDIAHCVQTKNMQIKA